jgi:hypothetical protein
LFHGHLVCIGGVPNLGSIRLGCRLSTIDFGDQCGETISAWDFDSIVMSVPNRDPFVSVDRAPSLPGAGVISIFYNDVKRAFFPWWEDQAPPAAPEFNYPGMPAPADKAWLPHGGPYHYIFDDLRLFLDPGHRVLLPGSPGYYVDIDDSPDPCSIDIAAGIDTPLNSVRIWSDTPAARLSNAKSVNDFNADGLLDLAIGAPLTNGDAGACYLFLGRLRDLVVSGEMKIEELGLPLNQSGNDQARVFDGIRVVGSPGDQLGQSQDSAGDFNNDGIGDVAIGSPLANDRRGGAVVFFGSREVLNLTEDEIPFDEIPGRGLGVIFVGEEEGDLAGARVVGCGDIDGDGNGDVLIAAPNRSVRADLNGDGVIDIDRTNCGVVYLVYGSPDLRGTLNLADVGSDQLPGAVFVGRHSGDFLGAGLGEHGDRSFGVSGAGDVDGDGFTDLLLSSVTASPLERVRAGEVYLLYGVGEENAR